MLKYPVHMNTEMQSFLDYLTVEKKHSKNTLAAYESDIRQLSTYAKSRGSQQTQDIQMNDEVLSGYLNDLRERKYTISTMARKIAAAKSFIKFLEARGKVRADLSEVLPSPQVTKRTPQSLSITEVKLLLEAPAKGTSADAKRDRMMLELLYATGLRVSELMGLNVEHVDFSSNVVHCPGTRLHSRYIPIEGSIVNLLREYLRIARPQLAVNDKENALILNQRGERLTRQGFWQIMRGYAHKSGLGDKVTPRSLRHSFAVHRLHNGADLQAVKELLGHAHISTTKAYKNL